MATPFTSFGYPLSIEAGEWPIFAPKVGTSPYGVSAGMTLTRGPGDRQVQISVGECWGWGVLDQLPTVQTLTHASVPGAGKRYDLVSVYRDWGTKETNLRIVQGTNARQIPPSPSPRAASPSVADDQPIWLVEVIGGQTTVGEIIDLRAWASTGGVYAVDTLVAQYLDLPGTVLDFPKARWSRQRTAVGGLEWKVEDTEDTGEQTTGLTVPSGSDWDVESFVLRRRSGRITGQVIVKRTGTTGGVWAVDSAGRLRTAGGTAIDTVLATLPAGYRPRRTEAPRMRGVNTPLPWYPTLNTDGSITLGHAIGGSSLPVNARFVVTIDHQVA